MTPDKKIKLINETTSTLLNKSKISPKPIVGDEFLQDIPLTEAFIGTLKQKKDTAVAIRSLTSILPGVGHLKRCFNGKLLLAFSSNNLSKNNSDRCPSFSSTEDLKKFLIDNKFDLSLLNDNFEAILVPEKGPRTKLQAKKANESWPVNFHPDLHVERVLNGNFFNSNQIDVINVCMRVCIEAAKRESIGNLDCNGSTVILNPNDNGVGRIIAVSAAQINEHPLWHSSMLAVDLVAAIRGRGAWQLISTECSCNNDEKNKLIRSNKRKIDLENKPFCYPSSLNSLDIPTFSHPIDVDSSSKTTINDANDKGDCPYLCTNYWAFLLQEPCPLCAMALLHSRVSMIFYGVPNDARGVLGSRLLLHTLPGLNHRYKVWSNILENDCMDALQEINERSNKTISANSCMDQNKCNV